MGYQYAYLFGNLVLCLPVWLVLFLSRKDLRKEMFLVSLFGGLAGPVSEIWYLQDYWKPQTFLGWRIGIEDFLFGFFIAGIASVFYEELFGKRFAKRSKRQKSWLWLLMPIWILFFSIFHGSFLAGVNSIYGSMIGFFAVAAFILIFRKDLFFDALASGLLVGLFMFFGYLLLLGVFPEIFVKWWHLQNISGVTLTGIPIEELLWGFSWGLAVGPIYEFLAGKKFQT